MAFTVASALLMFLLLRHMLAKLARAGAAKTPAYLAAVSATVAQGAALLFIVATPLHVRVTHAAGAVLTGLLMQGYILVAHVVYNISKMQVESRRAVSPVAVLLISLGWLSTLVQLYFVFVGNIKALLVLSGAFGAAMMLCVQVPTVISVLRVTRVLQQFPSQHPVMLHKLRLMARWLSFFMILAIITIVSSAGGRGDAATIGAWALGVQAVRNTYLAGFTWLIFRVGEPGDHLSSIRDALLPCMPSVPADQGHDAGPARTEQVDPGEITP